MRTKNIPIKNKLGLHVRPAAVIASIAKQASGNIYIEKNGQRVSADSVLDILLLYCRQNDLITLIADKDTDQEIIDHLEKLLLLDEIPL